MVTLHRKCRGAQTDPYHCSTLTVFHTSNQKTITRAQIIPMSYFCSFEKVSPLIKEHTKTQNIHIHEQKDFYYKNAVYFVHLDFFDSI